MNTLDKVLHSNWRVCRMGHSGRIRGQVMVSRYNLHYGGELRP